MRGRSRNILIGAAATVAAAAAIVVPQLAGGFGVGDKVTVHPLTGEIIARTSDGHNVVQTTDGSILLLPDSALDELTSPAPTPTPTPTADQKAVAKWTAPTAVTVGQQVTLDGSDSTGDAPIACSWGFENSDATAVYETATGCKITKTFTNADDKYVRLTVTDADGDTNSLLHSFTVITPQPIPTPTPKPTPTPSPSPVPAGCTKTITGGSLSTAMKDVASGGTVCLNAGNYSWSGTVTQTALTTAKPASGVTRDKITVNGGLDLGQSVNLKFQGMTVKGLHILQRTSAQHLAFDNIDFPNVPGGYGAEGRVTIQGPGPASYGGADIKISNSLIHGPGSDGIQLIGQASGLDIDSNEFTDIIQASCGSVHCDAIQTYGARYNRFDGNWMHKTSTGFANFDCNGDPQQWTNNVMDARQGTEPSLAFVMTGTGPNVAKHNVVLGATITIGSSNCQTNEKADITDNVLGSAPNVYAGDNWSSGAKDHNQYGTPSMKGGANPTSWAGYALSSAVAGSDGKSIGINP